MPICNCCRKHFDVEDFMDDNITESSICPDCYYSGNMIDDGFDECDEDDIDEDSYEDEDSQIIREALGDDLGYDESDDDFDEDEFSYDEDDYDDRLDMEEGDYE